MTGWKSLFGAGHQIEAGWINGVTERESEILKAYCKSRGSPWQRVYLRTRLGVASPAGWVCG